jgi:hypothetical protein
MAAVVQDPVDSLEVLLFLREVQEDQVDLPEGRDQMYLGGQVDQMEELDQVVLLEVLDLMD